MASFSIYQRICDTGIVSTTSQAVSPRIPLGSDRLIGTAIALYHITSYEKSFKRL